MKPRFNWRHQYDQTRDEAEGLAAGLKCDDESLTVQSFTKDADLNEIARRFGINHIPIAPLTEGETIDTTNFPDLRQILEAQREAANQFMALPHKLRKRFHNSPAELWQFINDPENWEEAVRLGLLSRPAEPENTSPPTARGTTTDGTSPTARPAQEGSPKEPEKTPKETPASK